MANAISLINATKGKNLIFSSEAEDAFGLRSPSDIMNLASTLGINASCANMVVSKNPKSILYHAGMPIFIIEQYNYIVFFSNEKIFL
jgi:ribonuclease P/MRP protein subunit RPP1